MKKEKRTFYRLYDNHKKKCDYIYEYAEKGQRFYLTKETSYPKRYSIIDSKTWAIVVYNLGYISKMNFEKICYYFCTLIPIEDRQRNFARVSKLKLLEE